MPRIDRQAIYDRDGGLCGFCGLPAPWELFHLDHIQPRGLGGPTTMENLRVAHQLCNISAGKVVRMTNLRRTGRDPDTEVPVTIRFPSSLRKRALDVGQAEDRTFASLVIYALRRYVEDRERERA